MNDAALDPRPARPAPGKPTINPAAMLQHMGGVLADVAAVVHAQNDLNARHMLATAAGEDLPFLAGERLTRALTALCDRVNNHVPELLALAPRTPAAPAVGEGTTT
jgi:hypothetical protein